MLRFVSANASLATEPSGPGRARLAVGRRPCVREPQHLGVDPEAGEPVAAHVVVALGVLAPDLERVADGTRLPAGNRAADRHALVHQRGERDPPPVAEAADAVGVGHAHTGQVHLVELGLAGDLTQRPDVDAGRVHVEREVGEPAVLRCFGIGARDEHPAVGPVRERVPHLLPVDDPLVAVADRTCRQAREVGTGAGLAEELAPQLLAGEQRSQEPRLELVVGVGRDRRRGEEDAEPVALERVGAHAGGTDALVDAPLELGRAARARRSPPGTTPRRGRGRTARRGTRSSRRDRARRGAGRRAHRRGRCQCPMPQPSSSSLRAYRPAGEPWERPVASVSHGFRAVGRPARAA